MVFATSKHHVFTVVTDFRSDLLNVSHYLQQHCKSKRKALLCTS